MSLEINRLINERRIGLDDGCDYGASILDTMNAAARARTKSLSAAACRWPSANRWETGPVVKIGNRNVYAAKLSPGFISCIFPGTHRCRSPDY